MVDCAPHPLWVESSSLVLISLFPRGFYDLLSCSTSCALILQFFIFFCVSSCSLFFRLLCARVLLSFATMLLGRSEMRSIVERLAAPVYYINPIISKVSYYINTVIFSPMLISCPCLCLSSLRALQSFSFRRRSCFLPSLQLSAVLIIFPLCSRVVTFPSHAFVMTMISLATRVTSLHGLLNLLDARLTRRAAA